MNHAISWFEIPTTDIDRAQNFYETIMGIRLIPMDMPEIKMRMFPVDDMQNGIGGALVNSDMHKPNASEGVLIYLNGNPDVQSILDKVPSAGGQIIIPKTKISDEYGYMAVITDTEGNRIAFHNVP